MVEGVCHNKRIKGEEEGVGEKRKVQKKDNEEEDQDEEERRRRKIKRIRRSIVN